MVTQGNVDGRFPDVHAEVWELMRLFRLNDQTMFEVANTGLCRVDQFKVPGAFCVLVYSI